MNTTSKSLQPCSIDKSERRKEIIKNLMLKLIAENRQLEIKLAELEIKLKEQEGKMMSSLKGGNEVVHKNDVNIRKFIKEEDDSLEVAKRKKETIEIKQILISISILNKKLPQDYGRHLTKPLRDRNKTIAIFTINNKNNLRTQELINKESSIVIEDIIYCTGPTTLMISGFRYNNDTQNDKLAPVYKEFKTQKNIKYNISAKYIKNSLKDKNKFKKENYKDKLKKLTHGESRMKTRKKILMNVLHQSLQFDRGKAFPNKNFISLSKNFHYKNKNILH